MMQNLILANISNGQVVTRRVAADKISDDLIRDGWVEVHRSTPPKVVVVVSKGAVEKTYSDQPGLELEVVDLDVAAKPLQEEQRLRTQTAGMFVYHGGSFKEH